MCQFSLIIRSTHFLFFFHYLLSVETGCSLPFQTNRCIAVEHFAAYRASYVWISCIDSSAHCSGIVLRISVKWIRWHHPNVAEAKWHLLGANFMHRIYFLPFFSVTFSLALGPSSSVTRSAAHQFIYRHHKIRITWENLSTTSTREGSK